MQNMKNSMAKKKTGIFRTGAIIPFGILVAIVVIFQVFFIDNLIKMAMEKMGTSIHGAEVNVSGVETKILDLSVEVGRIQFTNKDKPDYNNFEIGSISFALSWDALLRGKFVIEESSINDILLETKRSSRGYVPVVTKEEAEKKSETLQNAEKEFEGNIFGDIAKLLGGTSADDIAKNIEGELQSKKRYDELALEIKERESALKTQIDNLPKEKELKALEKKASEINLKDLTHIGKLATTLKAIDSVKKEVEQTIKQYDEAQKKVTENINFIVDSQKELKNLIQADIKDVQNRIGIPSLDATSIANVLFGREFTEEVFKYQGYFEKAQKYMPPPKEERTAPTIVARQRGEGVNYEFAVTTSYPLFWLKYASINSQSEQSAFKGELRDITSNQQLINRPSLLKIAGDYYELDMQDIDLSVSFDHRTKVDDQVLLSIGSYPVNEKKLANSDDVEFSLERARAKSMISATLKEKIFELNLNNTFSDIDYRVLGKNKEVDRILKAVAEDAKTISLDAKAKGTFKDLTFTLSSNLGKVLEASFNKQLQTRIAEAKEKISKEIQSKIQVEQDKINGQLAEFKSKYLGKINKEKEALGKIANKVKR